MDNSHEVDAYRSFDLTAVPQQDQEDLKAFIEDDAAALFDHVASQEGDDVELGEPEYYESAADAPSNDHASGYPAFNPKGWVGRYPGGFRVTQNRVPESKFQSMRSDVAMWIETAGPATARSLLRFLPDIAVRRIETYRSYSQRLIEETEEVLAHRPPVTTEFTRETGQQLRGRPLPTLTARERAKGHQTVVSQRVEFSLETLPNLLLIRFHLELAGSLAKLTALVPSFREMISGNVTYHQEYITDQFQDELIDQAISTEFDDPRVLAKTRQAATPVMNRIIDLWEGYRSQTPLAATISERLDTAILPAEKVYELYVLANLFELLEEVSEESPNISDRGLADPIQIGSFSLHYDRKVSPDQSRLLDPVFNWSSYRPDYVLEHKGDVIWVGDAKFKRRLDKEDGNRFVRYMIDLLPGGEQTPSLGTIFAPEVDTHQQVTEAGDYRIDVSRVAPTEGSASLTELHSWLLTRFSL